jgi:hypothetical protein
LQYVIWFAISNKRFFYYDKFNCFFILKSAGDCSKDHISICRHNTTPLNVIQFGLDDIYMADPPLEKASVISAMDISTDGVSSHPLHASGRSEMVMAAHKDAAYQLSFVQQSTDGLERLFGSSLVIFAYRRYWQMALSLLFACVNRVESMTTIRDF